MILGFLGKGGSGKSSVASQMAFFLCNQAQTVLAIDADHNMDLSYNLTGGKLSADLPYVSEALADWQMAVGVLPARKYSEVFLAQTNKYFTLSPLSPEIEKYSRLLSNGVRLMTAGPQTESVLYGQACSHSLTTPLKLLLPLLSLRSKEAVIVDEKAGADGVSTGIVTGLDVGVIVCEPAWHSIKTAKQIASLMDFYHTPYLFLGNKMKSVEDKTWVEALLGELAAVLPEAVAVKQNPCEPVLEWQMFLAEVYEKAKQLNKNDRLVRTREKFKRNYEFEKR